MDRATESGAVPVHGRDLGARADETAGPPPLGRSTAAVVLVALAVAATALAGPWDPPLRERADLAEPTPSSSPEQVVPTLDPFWTAVEQSSPGRPWDLRWVGLVLVALALLGVGYVAARVLRRLVEQRRGEGAPDAADLQAGDLVGAAGVMPDLPALREGVEEAQEHLRSRLAPHDAVIAAWVALEGAAATSGVRRDPAATPTEFTVVVLDRTPADPAATRTLLGLYLTARFSDEPLSAADVETATAAVRLLAEGVAHRDESQRHDDSRPHDDNGTHDDGGPTPPAPGATP